MKNAFDLWWEWAEKPHESMLMIPGDIHYPIMSFRQKIGATARRSTKLCVGTEKHGSAVPKPGAAWSCACCSSRRLR
jgi:hypothetical protein